MDVMDEEANAVKVKQGSRDVGAPGVAAWVGMGPLSGQGYGSAAETRAFVTVRCLCLSDTGDWTRWTTWTLPNARVEAAPRMTCGKVDLLDPTGSFVWWGTSSYEQVKSSTC